METISYKRILDAWCGLAGLDPARLSTTDAAFFNTAFNRQVRRAWEWYFWPALLRIEERFYRDTWTAQSYAAGAEVYHAGTDAYWLASSSATAGDVPGVASLWTAITDLDAYVALEQTGQTALGTVRDLYAANPRGTATSRRIPFILDERGATLQGEFIPPSVWVAYRLRCPVWSGAVYSASATYTAGQRLYYTGTGSTFDGDYFDVVSSTTAGQSPESQPAKWSRVEIPRFLGDYAAHAAFSDWLRHDGQGDKAPGEEGPAWAYLYDEQDKIERQSGQVRRARYSA